MKQTSRFFDIWSETIKGVQGRHGSFVASYFYFLKSLLQFYAVPSFLCLCFIYAPYIRHTNTINANQNTTLTAKKFNPKDLVTGEGWFLDSGKIWSFIKVLQSFLFRSVFRLVSNCIRLARVQHSNCLCGDDPRHILHLRRSNLQSRKTPLFARRSLPDDVAERHFEAPAFGLGLFNRRAAHGESAETVERAFYQRKTRQGFKSDFLGGDHVDQVCFHFAPLLDARFRFLRGDNRHRKASLRRFLLRLQILVQAVPGARENTADHSRAHCDSFLLANTTVRPFRRKRTFQQWKADNLHDRENSCYALRTHELFDLRAAATVRKSHPQKLTFF